jgi:hypothetical protein
MQNYSQTALNLVRSHPIWFEIGGAAILFAAFKILSSKPKKPIIYDRNSGNGLGFANIKEEIIKDIELLVNGKIPEWLEGKLYRSGPGIYDISVTGSNQVVSIAHWFDGLTVLVRNSFRRLTQSPAQIYDQRGQSFVQKQENGARSGELYRHLWRVSPFFFISNSKETFAVWT